MKFNLEYTKKFAALTLALLAIAICINIWTKESQILNPYIWYIFAYIIIIMYLSHAIIAHGFSKTAFDAQNFFMLGTTIKLLLTAVVIFIYFYIVKSHQVSFLLNFFVLYFVYTFFEIKTLLLSLHPHSKGGSNQ